QVAGDRPLARGDGIAAGIGVGRDLGTTLAAFCVLDLLDHISPDYVAGTREAPIAIGSRDTVIGSLIAGVFEARSFDLLRIDNRAHGAADHEAPLGAGRIEAGDDEADNAAGNAAYRGAAQATLHAPTMRLRHRASIGCSTT